ncbi:NADPH-dependent FMN reductase [Actibacterium sp. 188UL27-1]|uniref:NADPH-dependent FMN reductase n=1 Tax=Actibacterium sp. 188UL27-1 TaxID=2786961 RepID=UPI0019562D53|nr:NADPH-dependent FMN reductase [Actibacterium sp. 188UL27-1]MBM7069051.1 NAD(P)H-dependent oxidoreductase [Actibacterium sp. 188UL27-1]
MSLKLLGLCGSLRQDSFNRKLMSEAGRIWGNEDFSTASLDLPLYNGDAERADGIPQSVQTLARQIAEAHAVVIATPEYNQSISGVLKNGLDWISRVEGAPWRGKPVAIMSAAAGRAGGARAQYALRLCLNPFRPHLLPGPEVMVAAASQEFDDDGNLTGALYVKLLGELMDDLKAAART